MIEKKIQASIISYLKHCNLPIFYEKRQAGGYNYRKGIPDLYVVINGKHVEIEIKKEDGKRSNLQIKRENWFKEKNIDYYVCRSLEEFKEIIKKYL